MAGLMVRLVDRQTETKSSDGSVGGQVRKQSVCPVTYYMNSVWNYNACTQNHKLLTGVEMFKNVLFH